MEAVIRDLHTVAEHLHRRDETIVIAKGRVGPIARRHYASVAGAKVSDQEDISAWLDDTLRRLGSHPTLPDLMRSGQVQATLWIATLGADPVPSPVRVDSAHVAMATRLGARIFLEDYNRFDDGGVPLKTWLN